VATTDRLDQLLAELNEALAHFRKLFGRMTDAGASVTDDELLSVLRTIADRARELRSLARESPAAWAVLMAAYRVRSPEAAALVDEWLRFEGPRGNA